MTTTNGTNGALAAIRAKQSSTARDSQAPKASSEFYGHARNRIKQPDNIPALVTEIERDYQFKIGWLTVEALAKTIQVTFEPKSDSPNQPGQSINPRIQAVADNLTSVWRASLPYALRAFAYGRAAFEKRFQFDPARGISLLTDLDYLPPEDSRMWLDNDTGAFLGIKLTNSKTKEEANIPAADAWWCAIDATAKEPHGRSRYLGAAEEVWRQRRALENNEGIYLNRHALGIGLGRAPDKYDTDPQTKGDLGQTTDSGEPRLPKDDLAIEMEEVQSGGYMILSSARDASGNYKWDVDRVESKVPADPLIAKRRQLDAAALRSIGIPERAITQDDETGSLAMAKAHLQVLFSTVDGLLSQIVSSFKKYVMDKLLKLNFAGAVSIDIVWQKLAESEQAERITDIVVAILQSPQPSPFVTHGVVDLPALLEASSLPVGANADEVFAKLGGGGGSGTATEGAESGQGSPGVSIPGLDAALSSDAGLASGAVEKVQDAALNGAQVASMVNVLISAAAQQLPLDSVLPILEAAFPGIDRETLIGIVKPIYSFRPLAPSTGPASASGPQSSPTQLAIKPPPGNLRDPESLADRAIKDESSIIRQIQEALADRESIDRGRL